MFSQIWEQLHKRSPSDTSTTERPFHLGPTSSFFLRLFLCSSSVVYWTPTDRGSHLFAFSYCSWGSWGKNTGVICHSLLHWTMFWQNSPAWLVCLGWACRPWLIASLCYTRLWSMWSFWLAFCDCGFRSGGWGILVLASSVCFLMNEDKSLMQASWWEGLVVRKTESCFSGQSPAQ